MSGQKFVLFTSKSDAEASPALSDAIEDGRWNGFDGTNPVVLIERPDGNGDADIAIVWEPDSDDYEVELQNLDLWQIEQVNSIGVALHRTTIGYHCEQKSSIKCKNCELEYKYYSHELEEPYTLFISAAKAKSGSEYDNAIKCLSDFFRPDGYETAHELLLELLPDYLSGEIVERQGRVLAEKWKMLKEKTEKQRHWDAISALPDKVFDELDVLIKQVDGTTDYVDFKRKYEELYKKLGAVIKR